MFGPCRFGDLAAGLPGISAKVLTQRLEGFEVFGIVQRRKLPPPASVQVYELTPWGYQSERAIQEFGRSATRSPEHDPSLPLSAASLMLSFRTMHDPGAQRASTRGSALDCRGHLRSPRDGMPSISRARPDRLRHDLHGVERHGHRRRGLWGRLAPPRSRPRARSRSRATSLPSPSGSSRSSHLAPQPPRNSRPLDIESASVEAPRLRDDLIYDACSCVCSVDAS